MKNTTSEEEPRFASVLRAALDLPDASLVIYRRRTLVELKTDRLSEKLSRWEEDGHVSWQIGAFEDHHVHLDVAAVTAVELDARSTSCQGGRLNYTVWFLVDEDVGNPFRPEGYFSVTLNAPYTADGTPRSEILDAMFALHDRFVGSAGVRITERFALARASWREAGASSQLLRA
ncbi:MAG: hypothetical protein MUE69_07970 [Myxococcota bacterium]|jgi:hypothetical protein|nr:hypothetical protein [Myxococcota bacterium]